MTKSTWDNGYECHLGLIGDRRCRISQHVADNQREYDGRTIIAILADGRRMRVRLIGDDYGLHTTGCGDIIVRPIAYIK